MEQPAGDDKKFQIDQTSNRGGARSASYGLCLPLLSTVIPVLVHGANDASRFEDYKEVNSSDIVLVLYDESNYSSMPKNSNFVIRSPGQ